MSFIFDQFVAIFDILAQLWTWIMLPGEILQFVFSPTVLKIAAEAILTVMIDTITFFTPPSVDTQITAFGTFLTTEPMTSVYACAWWLVDQVAAAEVVLAILVARMGVALCFTGIRIGMWTKKFVWN